MCSITGALSFRNSAFEDTDGAGTWISNDYRMWLGHRRLSIIDLSDCATQTDVQRGRFLVGRFQWRDLQPRRNPRGII